MSDNLTVRYRGTRSPQVDAASFTAIPGVTAIVGKNGAGKTTLLRCLVGLQEFQSGTLSILGAQVANRRVTRSTLARIGYLPQDFGYVSSFTAREFVEYAAWLKNVPQHRIRDAAAAALNTVSLRGEADTKLRRLSGGMRRRAGIAQAIVHDPDILILDEPTTGLDPEQRVLFRELIRRIDSERVVLLSSHLIEDVKALAARILVMEGGQIRFDGTPPELERMADKNSAGDSLLEQGYMTVLQGRVRP